MRVRLLLAKALGRVLAQWHTLGECALLASRRDRQRAVRQPHVAASRLGGVRVIGLGLGLGLGLADVAAARLGGEEALVEALVEVLVEVLVEWAVVAVAAVVGSGGQW